MRLFLLLVCSCCLLFILLAATFSIGARVFQPLPMCFRYYQPVSYRIVPMQADPRSGNTTRVNMGPATEFEFFSSRSGMSPNGRAVAAIALSPYGGADALFLSTGDNALLRIADLQRSIKLGWSPDGNRLAYSFEDENFVDHLAITDYAGISTRTRSFGVVELSTHKTFAGWSADGNYVALHQYASGDTQTYYFLASDTLALVGSPVVANYQDPSPIYTIYSGMEWSPTGNRFAYLDRPSLSQKLIIATPEHGVEASFDLHIAEDGYVQLPLVWSPDGRYVALHRHVIDKKLFADGQGPLWEYWAYDIFGIDGSARTGIKGAGRFSSKSDSPDGQWTTDGSTWIFHQQLPLYGVGQMDKDVLSYLVAYHAETGTTQLIAGHVAGKAFMRDGSDWIAVPVWREAKINVELYKAGHLRYTIDKNFDEIVDMLWLAERRAFAYIARNGIQYTVGIVDLDSGATLMQLGGFPSLSQPDNEWPKIRRITASPSGNQIILKIGSGNQQGMVLISLVTGTTTLLRTESYEFGEVYWSPDESFFAFRQYDHTSQTDTLYVVSADGKAMHQLELGIGKYSSLSWTWCR